MLIIFSDLLSVIAWQKPLVFFSVIFKSDQSESLQNLSGILNAKKYEEYKTYELFT